MGGDAEGGDEHGDGYAGDVDVEGDDVDVDDDDDDMCDVGATDEYVAGQSGAEAAVAGGRRAPPRRRE